jgi:hypothetical protein
MPAYCVRQLVVFLYDDLPQPYVLSWLLGFGALVDTGYAIAAGLQLSPMSTYGCRAQEADISLSANERHSSSGCVNASSARQEVLHSHRVQGTAATE